MNPLDKEKFRTMLGMLISGANEDEVNYGAIAKLLVKMTDTALAIAKEERQDVSEVVL